MQILDRYLQAVKFWLPNSQQDIVAELRDDIRSQVEEQETSLGRSLNESEWEGLIKQRGRPLLVGGKVSSSTLVDWSASCSRLTGLC